MIRARRILKGLAVALGLVFLVGLVFVYWASREGHLGTFARAEVVRTLSEVCKIDATFQTFTFDPFPPQLRMTGLEMSHKDGAQLIAVDEAIVTLQILPLFARRLQLDRVAVLAPEATIRLHEGRIVQLPPCVAPDPDAPRTPIALGVRELTIERGKFDLLVDDTLEAHFGSIGISLAPRSRSSGSQLAIGVDDGVVVVGDRELPLHRLRLIGQLEGLLTAPRAVVIDELAVDLAQVSVSGSGSIDLFGPVYEAKLTVGGPLAAIHDFVDGVPATEGTVKVEISMSGTAASPSGVAKVVLDDAKVDVFELGDRVELEASADPERIDLRSLVVKLARGVVRAGGEIDLTRRTLRLEAEAEHISIGRLLDAVGVHGAWVDWSAAGKTTFEGSLDPVELVGPFDFMIRNFYVFDRAWDRPEVQDRATIDRRHVLLQPKDVLVRGRWSFTPKGLTVQSASVEAGDTAATATAFIGFASEDGVDIHADLARINFDDLGPIAGIQFGGQGRVTGNIHGDTHDLVGATGHLELESTTVSGIPFGRTAADLRWHDDDHLTFTNITAQLGETRYGGSLAVAVEGDVPFDIRGRIEDGRVEDALVPFGVDGREWGDPTGKLRGTFALTGPITRLSGPLELELESAAIVGETFERGTASARLEEGAVVVDELVLEKHGASITARGRIDPETLRAEVYATSEGLTLQKIDLMKASQPALDGRLGLVLELSGPVSTITGTVTAKLEGMTAGTLPIGGGLFSGHFAGPKLRVDGAMLGRALSVSGELGLRRGLPYRAELELDDFDIPRVLGALQGQSRWSGNAAGKARLTGSLIDWHLSSGDLSLERAKLDTGGFELETAAPAAFVMREGVLETRHVSLIGPKTRLTASGRLGARLLDLDVAGKVDLALVEGLSPAVERAGGVLTLASAIKGSPGAMNLVGTGKVDGGILQWRGFDARLSGFSADLVFSQSTVLIERGEGRVADGRVSITGDVLLADLGIKNLSLAISLDAVRPKLTYPLVEVSGLIDGAISVEGPPRKMVIRGELDVRRGRARPRADVTNLADDRGRLSVNVYDPSSEIIDMDLAFHGVDNLHIKNDTIDVELRGDLRLTGSNQRFGMLGTTNVVRGGRVAVLNREYEMVAGVIEFTDRYRFAPRYDLALATEACASRITVNIVGDLQQKPELSYTANPEMDETNIRSCLVRGVKVQERYDDLAKFASGALWKMSGLDREVKKVLPIDDIDITSEYSSQSKTYEPRVLIAKELEILGGPARLEYSSSLGKKEDQELRLRYRITPGLTLQGGWSSSKTVEPVVGDLHLDLKYRWEW